MAASTKDLSAQQTQHGPVRLLVAERSENAAYQFDSLLRDSGIATRLEVIDLPMAVDKLVHADMMLCSAALPELSQYLPRLASLAPRVPIIVVNNDDASLTRSEGMELGAADVVSEADERHLVLVFKRELEHVCQNLQLKQTRKALAEAERRCQLLLSSSRAAIAYVHEGMHIYANAHYLELFGFEDADDLLGLPLIDLLDGNSPGVLKEKLKIFRQNEEELDFDFTGRSTDGNEVAGNMTLAAAEYEGEHCIQVTVRPQADHATRLSLVAQGQRDDDATVPVLSDQLVAPAEDGDRPLPEDSAGTDDAGFELELELESEPSDDDATRANGHPRAEDADAGSDSDATVEPDAGTASELDADIDADTDIETAADAGKDMAVEPEMDDTARPESDDAAQPAAQRASGRRSRMGLSDFLSASEAIVQAEEGQFVSVFVAQVDGHEELQRAFGLAGLDDACRQVEAKLVAEVDAPFMQISPSQWAMLVCNRTRDDALDQVDRYRAAVEAMMFEVREKTVRPTCTFGGAILSMEGFDSIGTALEATLDNAIATLRNALASSDGNTVVLPAFENAEQADGDEANRILSLISEAISNQSFTLLFQPIISLRGDSDEHYEVFLRMNDREGKMMAPGEFLRLAIENRVAGKIDRWVILQSIKMLSAHRANGHNTRLTINLTSNSVADPEFIQWLGVAIKAARMPSDAVIFQITEADAATYVRQTREFVEGLKNLHCRSSLSRFGLEAEPFEVLGHIPVDFVKLDGSLIEALDANPEQKDDITQMIRDLQNAGKLTIVPMVESASLLSTLWQAGVNYIQGHYLQEPSTSMDYDFSTDD